MDRVARRGSLARAPGSLKSHNAEKLKGGTLWGFSTSNLSQNIKKLKGRKIFVFGKNLTVPKKLKGGTLWGKIFFPKKSLAVPKKKKGGSFWSRPVWYVTRKSRKNLFGSVR